MDDATLLPITARVSIPLSELTFSATRSGGPGGQHVNTTSTRVALRFDLDASPSLDPADKERIRAALGKRVGKDGVIQVVSQNTRSQWTNREIAIDRFATLLRAALAPKPPRHKTRATLASKRRRLETKTKHGAVKRQRARPTSDD